jgi:hypothetical protein
MQEERIAEKTVAYAQTYAEEHGVRATRVEKQGPVSETILLAAEEAAVDLVVMGGYGSSPMVEWAMGSTVEEILQSTRWPVLVCQQDRAPPALPSGAGKDPPGVRAGDGLGALVDAELAVHAGRVALDGAERDIEPLGDLVVGQALGNERQHLVLAVAQWLDERGGRPRGLPCRFERLPLCGKGGK